MPTTASRPVAAGLAAAVLAAVVLFAMGRTLWCDCASLAPWSGEVMSRHNSQHLFDPYTFTHVLHGVAFFALLRAVAPRLGLPWRAAVAVALEAIWEVLENTDAVIDKYREATISLDYYGDSVANSMADLGACLVGFALASRLPVWASIAFFVAVELALAWWIRDGLLLNVLMLLYPLEAVKRWQSGG